MGSFTPSAATLKYQSDGSYGRVDFTAAATGTYNNTGNDTTTGDTLTAASLGMAQIISVTILDDAGYLFEPLGLDSGPASSIRLKIFQGAAGTTGATSGGTPAGTNGTSAVTGSAIVDLATPVFSGTGQSSAGQVITTTDNQTMTLNQCAGMWFVSATHGPYLIASNTAVSGAPAVLTIVGTAPTTDAGTYVIVRDILSGTAAGQTFTGSALSTHTHSVGAAAGGEVPNGTNLTTSLAAVRMTVQGY